MLNSTNYPDLLGYVTNGMRVNLNMAHVALAVRPNALRAGSAFELILLAQSAVDVDVDLAVTLHLPDSDAKRQRGKFLAKSTRLIVGMKPAEVGYVVIPVTLLPDTHPAPNYKIGVEVEVKSKTKGMYIRNQENGWGASDAFVSPAVLKPLRELRDLQFATGRRLGRNIIDVTFEVLPPKLGQGLEERKAGWVSLFEAKDYNDPRARMKQYGAVISAQLLPRIKREMIYEPLTEATIERFSGAGYPLHLCEAKLIARLMTLVLEFSTHEAPLGYSTISKPSLKSLFARDPMSLDVSSINLPRWFQTMINAVAKDERAVAFPHKVIPKFAYDELLFDAIMLGFEAVSKATPENFGTPSEMEAYAQQTIEYLGAGGGIDFSRVYLPLVMGGILLNDKGLLQDEDPSGLLREVGSTIEERVFEISEDDMPLYTMTNDLIMKIGHKYGFYK